MINPASDTLFGSDLWEAALEKYGSATHLTVQLFDADELPVLRPVHATPLFQLFDETGYDPGMFCECAHNCLAQTEKRPAVLVSQFHGLTVVGVSLALEDKIVGAAVGGYAFADFSQLSEIRRLTHQAGIIFERVWEIARKQRPVPRERLIVHGELLQVLGDALLREHYRRRQWEQAAAIVNSSDDAIISQDLDGVTTSWNAGAERLFGYAGSEAVGEPVARLIHPDGLDFERVILDRIRRGEKIEHYETVCRRKDRSAVEISLSASPTRDTHGRIVGASQIARDNSERRRYESHRELLINELNHRVKNTLAMVQSLVRQSLRNAATLDEGLESFETRLLALAKAHDVLTREHWEGAGLDRVVADAIAPYSGQELDSRFQVAGPNVRLQPRAVLALAMALHELATNAVKYGALSNRTGKVAIDWRLIPGVPQRLQLRWEESGGPPVEEPKRRGFGSRLVERGLAQDLAGEVRLAFERGGLVCTIEAPLDEIAGPAPAEPPVREPAVAQRE